MELVLPKCDVDLAIDSVFFMDLREGGKISHFLEKYIFHKVVIIVRRRRKFSLFEDRNCNSL